MMQRSNLPYRARFSQRVVKPIELSVVEISRVEHEKIHEPVAATHRVIARAAHVEVRIIALVPAPLLDVVVSEHRVELHALFEQAGERLLEMLDEVTAAA